MVNGVRLMPDRGGALREQPNERIPVPIYGDRMMLMTPEAARALRDPLKARKPRRSGRGKGALASFRKGIYSAHIEGPNLDLRPDWPDVKPADRT